MAMLLVYLMACSHRSLKGVHFHQLAFSPSKFAHSVRTSMSKHGKAENGLGHLFQPLEHVQSLRRTVQSIRSRVISVIQTHVPGGRKLSNDYLNGCIDTLLTTTTITLMLYSLRLASRHYRTVDDIPMSLIRRQGRINALVSSVGDGDNLRVRHIPPLKFPFRKLDKGTISIRLAAIDAPECTHGLRPGQPYGPEAREWLKQLAKGRHVHVQLHYIDQYRRVIATVFVKHRNPILNTLGLASKNAGLELTKAGYATLYKGPNAKYGGSRRLAQYIRAENRAQAQRKGMWKTPRQDLVLPGEFKKMIRRGSMTSRESNRPPSEPTDSTPEQDNLMRVFNLFVNGYQWLRRLR